ncbi:hypothetical protein, partial [Cetobacterium sp.]|uniref:hypothetical protein n=1 Tax=Cetobacterium sp. TaxID=2071632 RepID=UPI003EE625B1
EEIRVAWNAHTIDNLFEARNFWLDKDLFDMLQKPYSVDEPKTILTVLRERNWFETITSIPRFETAMIVEDNNDCFGYIEDLPLGIHREYREATTDIYMLEEHISSLMIFQPKSMTKLEGCK